MHSFRCVIKITVAALVGHAGVSAGEVATVREKMRSEEIAARLMAGSQRSIVQVAIENVWQNERLICTPHDWRAEPSNRAYDVVRRPRLQVQIGFDSGSANIAELSRSLLQEIAAALRNPAIEQDRFIIVGHTDAVGPEDYNRDLSHRRATAVGDFLMVHGIERHRLRTVGCGEMVILNPDDRAAAENRRIEIVNAGPK